jgi:hypothetical protein
LESDCTETSFNDLVTINGKKKKKKKKEEEEEVETARREKTVCSKSAN